MIYWFSCRDLQRLDANHAMNLRYFILSLRYPVTKDLVLAARAPMARL